MGNAKPRRKPGESPGYKAKPRCGKQGVAEGFTGEIGLVRAVFLRGLQDLRIYDAKEHYPEHGTIKESAGKIEFEHAWEWMFDEGPEAREFLGFQWCVKRLGFESWDLEFKQKAWEARLKRGWHVGMQCLLSFGSESSE